MEKRSTLASLVGLAPIVGAFAAGLVVDEAHFESFRDHGEQWSLQRSKSAMGAS
jgi:hypothetical protein